MKTQTTPTPPENTQGTSQTPPNRIPKDEFRKRAEALARRSPGTWEALAK
jgi:hypothetical protein